MGETDPYHVPRDARWLGYSWGSEAVSVRIGEAVKLVGVTADGGDDARAAIEAVAGRWGLPVELRDRSRDGKISLPRGGGLLLVRSLTDVATTPPDAAAFVDKARRLGWRVLVVELAGDLDPEIWKRRGGARPGRKVDIPDEVAERIRARRRDGASLRQIADELNEDGVATARGGARWYASTVGKVLAREGIGA